MEEEKWSPNEALANILECSPEQCRWVWNSAWDSRKKMRKSEAFRIAREMQRDL